jgi:hypothetical protein
MGNSSPIVPTSQLSQQDRQEAVVIVGVKLPLPPKMIHAAVGQKIRKKKKKMMIHRLAVVQRNHVADVLRILPAGGVVVEKIQHVVGVAARKVKGAVVAGVKKEGGALLRGGGALQGGGGDGRVQP